MSYYEKREYHRWMSVKVKFWWNVETQNAVNISLNHRRMEKVKTYRSLTVDISNNERISGEVKPRWYNKDCRCTCESVEK